MLYQLLRWLAGTALRWFYRDVEVDGAEAIPRDGPIILAVNHPNALVDALVVVRLVPRRITLTAKATLFENPVLRVLLRAVGIVPLRRAHDEDTRTPSAPTPTPTPDRSRNADAFRSILDTLERGSAVMIFPEGISHSAPELAPLKTGLARLALAARDDRHVRNLVVVPVGLTFERKWAPRTRIFVHVGEPIAMDNWHPRTDEAPADAPADALTHDVDDRLRAITLNYPTPNEATRILGLARLLAGLFDDPRPLGAPDPPLAHEMDAVRRIEAVRHTLPTADMDRATVFLERLETLRVTLATRQIAPNEIHLIATAGGGARFAARESAIILTLGPIAAWGWLNHWIPLRITRAISHHVSRTPEDPAMNTLVIGLGLVMLFYALQAALVWRLTGAVPALLYLISLPAAATWHQRFRDRMERAWLRMRTYFRFRADLTLQPALQAELTWLRAEALEIEAMAGEARRTA